MESRVRTAAEGGRFSNMRGEGCQVASMRMRPPMQLFDDV